MELKRILLVEDSLSDIKLIISALRAANLTNEVITRRDGVECLDYLFRRGQYANRGEGTAPIVVLLDLKMPRMDGLETLAAIRAEAEYKTLPVVIITSSREEQDVARSYNLGVNGYVVKPVTPDDFLKAIKEVGLYWAVVNQPPPQMAGH